MRRAERKEQEELAGRKKTEAVRARMLETQERERQLPPRPTRIARVGKPLKR